MTSFLVHSFSPLLEISTRLICLEDQFLSPLFFTFKTSSDGLDFIVPLYDVVSNGREDDDDFDAESTLNLIDCALATCTADRHKKAVNKYCFMMDYNSCSLCL